MASDRERSVSSVTSARAMARLRNRLGMLLILYLTVAHMGVLTAKGGEYFPVFSWSLFSIVKDEVTEPELELVAIDGEVLAAPVTYFAMSDRFVEARRRNIEFRKMLYRFMEREWRGGDNSALLMQIENRFLAEARSANWRIVGVTYRPLDRHRDGSVIRRDVLYESEFER